MMTFIRRLSPLSVFEHLPAHLLHLALGVQVRISPGTRVLGHPLGEVRTLASDAALRRLGAGEDMLLSPQMHAQRTALLLKGRVRIYEEGPPTGRSRHRWPRLVLWWGLRG